MVEVGRQDPSCSSHIHTGTSKKSQLSPSHRHRRPSPTLCTAKVAIKSHQLEGLRGLGRVHEDRLSKDVAYWERAFDLLAGQGTDEVQHGGCGSKSWRRSAAHRRHGRRSKSCFARVVQRCLHHPGMHLAHDQFHSSEPAKVKKAQHKAAEASCLKTSWTRPCCRSVPTVIRERERDKP